VLLCRRPNLWLLDEPHAGLDAAGRQLVNELVADASAAGATVVIASHDQEWAAPIATRTLSVVGGQVHS
jgi:energy-coupling factor transporter ATP-binding protein EcfA2